MPSPIANEADEWFALRTVSLAARGLLSDLAYLWRRSVQLDRSTVCRIAGIAEDEFDCLAEELKRASVVSFDDAGFIHCPRLEAESKRRALARQNGKRGGNPALIAARRPDPPIS
jgi:hypothetical protein